MKGDKTWQKKKRGGDSEEVVGNGVEMRSFAEEEDVVPADETADSVREREPLDVVKWGLQGATRFRRKLSRPEGMPGSTRP